MRLVPGPAPRSWSATSRPSQSTRTRSRSAMHLDPPADHRRVHRVVVAVQPHVVVPRQPGRRPPPGRRRDRRQRQHRGPVGGRPVGRRAAQRPRAAGCSPAPASRRSWVLKSAGRGERAPGQERGLQVAVGPLDQALGLRVARAGRCITLMPSVPRNAWHSLGQLGPPAAPAPDRALAVPDQQPAAPHPAARSAATCPANRSARRAGTGSSRADSHRE